MRRIALPLVLAAAVAAGCGAGSDEGRRTGALAAVARIACDRDGARVLTPEVKPQRDGLHLQVTNETAREVDFTVERDSRGGAGGAAPPGTSEHVLTIRPGEWTVTCYVESAGSAGPAAFELVDTGIWVSTEIDDCEFPEASHGDPPRTVTDDANELPELTRRGLEDLMGLAPGYAVEPAGYPEQKEAIFRARRDGRTIGTMSFYPDGRGGWLEGAATACADLGATGSGEVGG